MSLLDYFKRKEPLPDPRGSLARVISSSAIAAANSEVERNPCIIPSGTFQLFVHLVNPIIATTALNYGLTSQTA